MMDIFACVELVRREGFIILAFLFVFGLGGVGLHIWWSMNLKFCDLSQAKNKGNLKRLLIPLIPVSLLSVLLLITFVLVYPEFRKCLENPEIVQYLNRLWTYIFPVVGTGISVSALVCAFIGIVIYWVIGIVFYLITRLRWW